MKNTDLRKKLGYGDPLPARKWYWDFFFIAAVLIVVLVVVLVAGFAAYHLFVLGV